MRATHYDFDCVDNGFRDGNPLLRSRALLFVVVSVVSLAILSLIGFLLHTFNNPPIKIAATSLTSAGPAAHALAWDGIALGSRLDAVAKAHPRMRIEAGESGTSTGLLVKENETLKASFLGDGGGGRLYRMQVTRTVPTADASEALAPFLAAHRHPNTFQCRENPLFSARECEAVWWLQDSTRLDVTIRVTPPNSQVVAIATQLHLEGLGRAAGRPR